MIKGAIFDFDGTLFDSMYVWENFASDYLRSKGLEALPENEDAVRYMSLPEAAAYFSRLPGVHGTVNEIMTECNNLIEHEYFCNVTLRNGVKELLVWLRQNGITLYIATATDRYLVEAAIRRVGISEMFSGIITSTEAGSGKTRPDIFLMAAKSMGALPKETWVFEDAMHAVKSAATAGFRICAVYDKTEDDHKDLIKAASDIYIEDFSQLDYKRLL